MSAIPISKPGGGELRNVPLAALRPHPQNPRKITRDDVVENIAAQLRQSGAFHPSHALIVRRIDGASYQIISGHNRSAAAKKAGLKDVPVWVRDMDDGEAFLELVLSNAHGELHPLEKGEHARLAVEGGIKLRAYAAAINVDEKTVHTWKSAADVVVLCAQNFEEFTGHVQHLSLIHAAPQDTWADWVKRLVENGWTVEELRAELKRQKPERAGAPEKAFYRIGDWEALSDARRKRLSEVPGDAQFNAQDTTGIEWARWSWNPVTGCLHNCPYCYARDIAERFYPQKFEPALIPGALRAPANTAVPANAADNIAYRNVFTCSMADLFGKWVPDAWIESVLDQVRANPQWNFLFLTKFPQRMAEFAYPANAWLGTTVDLQARVKNAERAMAKVKASVRWLSLEPLLDPIDMDWSLFQWIVIGGASSSRDTPPWQPPRRWIWEITLAAEAKGCAVYHKDNLAHRLRNYPGAVEPERPRPPAEFQYLKVLSS
jgi:ParB/RepB/Spo0J family partition protein